MRLSLILILEEQIRTTKYTEDGERTITRRDHSIRGSAYWRYVPGYGS